MTNGHVLLVDDDRLYVASLQFKLRAAGCKVSTTNSGSGAIDSVLRRDPDIVFLDLDLPDMDGKLAICGIRQSSRVPIIVISKRSDCGERIRALDEGADDYVSKPFDFEELMARSRAAVRRAQSSQREPERVQIGPLKIDFAKRQVEIMGQPIRLSPRAFSDHSGS